MTFEKQGTAIAEPLSISDDAQDAADDSVVDEADSVEASVPEQIEAPAMEQESPAIDEAPKTDESRPYSTQIFTMPAPSDPGARWPMSLPRRTSQWTPSWRRFRLRCLRASK